MDARQATRRRFLKEGVTLAGLAVGARSVGAHIQGHGAGEPERIATHAMAFGERSRFVTIMRPTMTNIGRNMFLHGEPDGLDAFTPLSELVGSITPSDLHYVSSHGSLPPDIDPRQHRLVISGMVERPLVFTMDELMRLPAVSRVHYIECVVNRPMPEGKTLEQMHGMVACSEWTGVPLAVLLNEAGVKAGANWVFAEGAEAIRLGASLPLGKAMDDVLVAYGQNGEPVRPHQGYPLRLVVPGFQGKYHVKWLRRIRLVNRPLMSYWEKHHFMKSGDRPGGEARGRDWAGDFYLEQGPKSIITFPSGGQRLPSPGYYRISGLAWSGCGAVRRVEVSTDGGQSWNDATIEEPARRIAWTRFTAPWTWNGREAVLQSRCTDDKGQVQPTAADYPKFWGTSGAPHGNAIQPWRVTNEGILLNAL
jgi:sulfane dehydrogenase subunit SoxC